MTRSGWSLCATACATSSTSRPTNPRLFALFALLGPQRARSTRMLRRILDPVDTLLFEVIRGRRGEGGLGQREDVLSMLIQARHEDGAPMSDQELRDELMTL